MIKKIRYIIKANLKPPIIVYTDYSAVVPISRQTTLNTTSTDKLNLRLVRASQYLSSFNLKLRHKAGKANMVPDALSRLATTSKASNDLDGILNALCGVIVPVGASRSIPTVNKDLDTPEVYHTTLINITDDFKTRLRKAYDNNPY